MKLKFFPIKNEQEINDFLATHRVLQDGIRIYGDAGLMSVSYSEQIGFSPKDAISMLNAELAKMQSNRISAELERRYWTSREIITEKSGGQAGRNEAEGNRHQAEAQIEECDGQIRRFKDLIAEIEKGEYVI